MTRERLASVSSMARQCPTCSVKITGGQKALALSCATCTNLFHTACLSDDWKEVTKYADLAFISKRGLLWYCDTCLKRLSGYSYVPDINEKLDTANAELLTIKKLLCETIETTKSCSQTAVEQTSIAAEITKRVEDNLESESNMLKAELQNQFQVLKQQSDTIQQQAKTHESEERKKNAIVYNISEKYYLEDHLLAIMHELSFNSRSVHQWGRLGRSKKDKDRPIKIKFESEVSKNDFLWRLNRWDRRGNYFGRNDIPPDEQEKEYRLRMQKRDLESEQPETKFRIRGERLWKKSGNHWLVVTSGQASGKTDSNSDVPVSHSAEPDEQTPNSQEALNQPSNEQITTQTS